ncbi:hypothetical protein CICLE_v10003192mg [Citrus x clementina]|uniref:O-methyltransferase C-terminal domain-containing protein n=1 Tax=Citrus clementina TaxID=85681 RepID=V4SBJ8_CITCL|nr:hypothetical protein CICLE_v10003192mg [Citrus x clementina]
MKKPVISLEGSTIVLLIADATFTTSFHFLSTWLQNDDQTLFGTADGKNFWDYVADEVNFKSIFYEAMITDFELIASVLIEDCNELSKGLKSLVDVGGSTGTMARAIGTAFPDTKCTVFDLPLVVDNLVGTNNLDFFGGNMFEAIPPPNAVLLKGGKVIIIDVAIENQTKGKETMETQLCFDMLMATFLKGKEQTGFNHYKITPNLGLWSLIEAYP